MRAVLLLLATLAALLGVGFCDLQRNERAPRAATPRRDPPKLAVTAPRHLPALPRSLEGTDVDGRLAAREDGTLIVDDGTWLLFDYFLTAEGEEPRETIRARVVAQAAALPEPARTQAIELFDRYAKWPSSLSLLDR
jgi:lipase chaperone LimK